MLLRRMAGTAAVGFASAVLLGGCSTSESSPHVGLSAQRGTIDKAWRRDPHAAVCIPENLALTCHYVYKGMHIVVAYASNGHAEQISVSQWPHHRTKEWAFLKTTVPSGAHLVGCKDLNHSMAGGPAHACIYRLKRSVIVAYFPHPNDPTFAALVAYDYASYQDIKEFGPLVSQNSQ